MYSLEIRKKFLAFFAARGHVIAPSSSLLPDDPSVLLTTAGVQQFKPYYTGEADPLTSVHPNLNKPLGARNVASIQKSFRTSDIDEVGDERHLTFFEMMGNFSFGGYFKKEAIAYAFDFITREMQLPISYVTIFRGSAEAGVPRDDESRAIWRSLGIDDVREEGMEDVFWGPTGNSGPCGPTTEIYCKNGAQQDIEVWNLVFNEFFFPGSREELLSGVSGKKLDPLKTPGVDTGMGFERLVMCAQKTPTIFETDLFHPLLAPLPSDLPLRHQRIVADHLRATAFLLADGVRPSNKEAGYVLRRLMRRALVYQYQYHIGAQIFDVITDAIVRDYGAFYPELSREQALIRDEMHKEQERFGKSLERGIRELRAVTSRNALTPESAFQIYETFGLPYEIIKELGADQASALTREAFDDQFRLHQEKSRAGQEKKFGGHGLLLDTGELKAADERELAMVTRLHTATHLLQAALREVLGPEVSQQGSDITAERTRFDFTFPRKLTTNEVKQVQDLVNDAIRKNLTVEYQEMAYPDALASGALHFFRTKYPPRVKVYRAYDPATGAVFSHEFCGGPHVKKTSEIGAFRIIKEEASSAGVRRIRAVVQ